MIFQAGLDVRELGLREFITVAIFEELYFSIGGAHDEKYENSCGGSSWIRARTEVFGIPSGIEAWSRVEKEIGTNCEARRDYYVTHSHNEGRLTETKELNSQ